MTTVSIGPVSVTSSRPEAVILNPTSPTPTVQFLGRGGGYEFQLTVTDDKGSMGMDSAPIGIDP